MLKNATLLAVLVAAAACAPTTDVTSFSCLSDDNCPPQFFCDTAAGKCAAISGTDTVTIGSTKAVTVLKTEQLSAHAQGGVTWSVQTNNGGSISGAGVYTAPAVPGTYTVVATSTADPTQSATATVQVVAAPETPEITAPSNATAGDTGLQASLGSPLSTDTFLWTISAGGTITSPASDSQLTFSILSSASGTVTLTCTANNQAGDSESATATITLSPQPITPTINAPPNAITNQQGLTASVSTPEPGNTYSWGISNGTIQGSANGNSISFTAGNVGAVSLTCTASNAAGATAVPASASVTVLPGPAVSLSLSGVPSSIAAGVSSTLIVTALDSFGNAATGYTGQIAFASTDTKAVLPSSYVFVASDAGIHSFSGVKFGTVGTQSISAADSATSSIAGSITGISVSSATTLGFTISGFPSPVTAGASGAVTVAAIDGFGNLVTSYRGTVQLSSSDATAALPPAHTFTSGDAGTYTFTNVVLKTAGTQSLTATDSANNILGTQSGIIVNAAAVAALSVSGFPTAVVAGVSGSLTVAAKDSFGNTAGSYRGTVTITASNMTHAVLPTPYTFLAGDAGTHTFSGVQLGAAGTLSITATDASNSLSGSESNITVSAAAAVSVTVSGFPSSIVAGVTGSLAVTLFDSLGNQASGYRGTVVFSSSDPSGMISLPGIYQFTAGDSGTHIFAGVSLATVGSRSITATDSVNSLTASQTGITVKPAGASVLLASGFPTSPTAGVLGSLTVTAQDQFGNIATGYTGTVALSSTDPKASAPAAHGFNGTDAGVHVFSNIALKTAGSQTLTATDTTTASINGSESGIVVSAAGAATLTVTGFPSPNTAGIAGSATVTALDPFGNIATGYLGTVHFTSSAGSQAVLPANYTFTAGNAGAHAFANIQINLAGTEQLIATDTVASTLTGAQAGIIVNPAAASIFVVSGLPTTQTAGTINSLGVLAQDPYGNTATGFTGNVHLTSTDTQAILPADYIYKTTDSGVHNFPGSELKTVGTQSFTATAGSVQGSDSTIISAGQPEQLSLSGITGTIYACVSLSLTVAVEDPYNNIETSYAGTVTLTTSDGKATLPAAHTYVSSDKGTYQFTGIKLSPSSITSITATATASPSNIANSFSVAVQPGAAATLNFTGLPASATAGKQFGFSVVATDACSNVATGFTGSVGFTDTDPAAVLPGAYTYSPGDSGIHAFTATLNTAGAFNLAANTAGVTSANSNIPVLAAATQPQLSYTDFILTGSTGSAVVVSPQTGITYTWSISAGATLLTSPTGPGIAFSPTSGSLIISCKGANANGDSGPSASISAAAPTIAPTGMMLVAGLPGGAGSASGQGSKARMGSPLNIFALSADPTGDVFFNPTLDIEDNSEITEMTESSGNYSLGSLPLTAPQSPSSGTQTECGNANVAAANANTLYAICLDTSNSSQYVAQLSRGGTAWTSSIIITLPTFNAGGFVSIAVGDPNTLFIARSDLQKVLKYTVNAGTWTLSSSFNDTSRSIAAFDDNHVYSVNTSYGVSLWTYSGTTWSQSAVLSLPTYGNVYQVGALGPALAAVATDQGAAVLALSSGTWSVQSLGEPSGNLTYSLAAVNPTTFYVGGDFIVSAYTLSGGVWSSQVAVGAVPHTGFANAPTGPAMSARFYLADHMSKIDASDFLLADYYGGIRELSLIPTSSGATTQTWAVIPITNQVPSASLFQIPCLSAVGSNVFFAGYEVSANGTIDVYKYTLISGTWQTQQVATGLMTYSLQGIDASTFFGFGPNGALQVFADNGTTNWPSTQTVVASTGINATIYPMDATHWLLTDSSNALAYRITKAGSTYSATAATSITPGTFAASPPVIIDAATFYTFRAPAMNKFTYNASTNSWTTTTTTGPDASAFVPGPLPAEFNFFGESAAISSSAFLFIDQNENVVGEYKLQ